MAEALLHSGRIYEILWTWILYNAQLSSTPQISNKQQQNKMLKK